MNRSRYFWFCTMVRWTLISTSETYQSPNMSTGGKHAEDFPDLLGKITRRTHWPNLILTP